MTHFTATATIHRGHLRHNLDVIRRQQPGAPVMAMVKANAYGHGLVDVARAIGSVDSLAVARIEEAEQLRAAGIDKPLVLLEGVFDAQGMTAAAALGCELVVHTPEQIALLRQHPDSDAFVTWLKLDSGMHRLGFDIADAASAIGALRGIDAVRELRLMSHYASADDRASDFSQRQFERMRPVLEIFDGAISLANSPALLRDDAPALDGASGRAATGVWLRPGIAVYGISPFDGVPAASLDLRPAMDFETRLISVRDIKAGDSVGYGGRFVAPGRMRIGIAAVGYGDPDITVDACWAPPNHVADASDCDDTAGRARRRRRRHHRLRIGDARLRARQARIPLSALRCDRSPSSRQPARQYRCLRACAPGRSAARR